MSQFCVLHYLVIIVRILSLKSIDVRVMVSIEAVVRVVVVVLVRAKSCTFPTRRWQLADQVGR